MELKQAIEQRRSVRKFTEEPVEKELLRSVLELSLQAPSWKNSQCWEFVAVEDTACKKILTGTVPETNPAYQCLHTAPYVVVVVADPAKVEQMQGKQYFMGDAGMAFYAFWLACHDVGLATVCVGEIIDETPVKQVLGIPEGKRVYCLAPVGYPLYQPKQRPRDSFEQKVFFGQYGHEFDA